jgi:hypothetical protein
VSPQDDVSTQVRALADRVAELEAEVTALRAEGSLAVDGTGPRFAAVYAQFADRFRGSRVEVTAKLRPYLADVTRVLRPGTAGR